MRIIILTSVLFFSLCSSALAIQDNMIELKEGKLIGLPEKYQSAFLDLEKMSLRIGKNQLDFGECISMYFPDDKQYKLQITAF